MIGNKIFSIPGCFMIVAALCAAVSVDYQESVFGTLMLVSLGWFCYGKLALAMFFFHGYGVRKAKVLVGMPVLLVGTFVVLASIVGGLLFMAYQPTTTLMVSTIARLRAFSWAAAVGVVVALFHWYLYTRSEYFHESEYEVRCACVARGASPRVTKAVVSRCRRDGILAP